MRGSPSSEGFRFGTGTQPTNPHKTSRLSFFPIISLLCVPTITECLFSYSSSAGCLTGGGEAEPCSYVAHDDATALFGFEHGHCTAFDEALICVSRPYTESFFDGDCGAGGESRRNCSPSSFFHHPCVTGREIPGVMNSNSKTRGSDADWFACQLQFGYTIVSLCSFEFVHAAI